MVVKQIKLSSQAKDRLGRLKGKTGIKNWNVLCRWAFCYSLGEYSMPTDVPLMRIAMLKCHGLLLQESIVIYMMRL